MRDRPIRSWVAAVLVAIVLLYAALLVVAPILAVFSGAFAKGVGEFFAQITSSDALNALRLTFVIAVLASAINVVFGVVIAWVLVRHNFPGKTLVNGLVDLPFVVSPVIVGFVIIVLFGRQGWLTDLPIQIAFAWPGILLVTVFVALPFVIREVMPVLASLTIEQEEAAYTLGASRWLVFHRVIFPGIRYGVVYGLVLTFARSLGEFGAAAVAGGGIQGITETATIYIFRSIHDRNNIGAYSMAILLGIVSVLVLLVMNWIRTNLHRSRSRTTGDGDVNRT